MNQEFGDRGKVEMKVERKVGRSVTAKYPKINLSLNQAYYNTSIRPHQSMSITMILPISFECGSKRQISQLVQGSLFAVGSLLMVQGWCDIVEGEGQTDDRLQIDLVLVNLSHLTIVFDETAEVKVETPNSILFPVKVEPIAVVTFYTVDDINFTINDEKVQIKEGEVSDGL